MQTGRSTNFSALVFAIIIATALVFVLLNQDKPAKQTKKGSETNSAEAYYLDQVITLIVPNQPGGGYDRLARDIAPFLEKYSGARVQVKNVPGAGGIRGLSEISKSPPNGLFLGLINGSGHLTNRLMGSSGAESRIDELAYLARVAADLRVLVVSANSQLNSFDDLINSDRTIKLGSVGLGGSTYVDAVIAKYIFQLNASIVHGFDSSSTTRHAIVRGSIEGSWSSYGSIKSLIDDGQVIPVLQGDSERSTLLPQVPSIFEFIPHTAKPGATRDLLDAWLDLKKVGRVIVAPKAIPVHRSLFIQKALDLSLNDPELIRTIAKSGRIIDFLSGTDLETIVQKVREMPLAIQDIFIHAVAGHGQLQ